MVFLVVGDDFGVFSLGLLDGVAFSNELASSPGGVDSGVVSVCIILRSVTELVAFVDDYDTRAL